MSDKRSQPIEVWCQGGCGIVQRVRPHKMQPCDYYYCGKQECEKKLPPRQEGQITRVQYNAVACFTGLTYVWPNEEEKASLQRAKELLAIGTTQLILKHLQDQKDDSET